MANDPTLQTKNLCEVPPEEMKDDTYIIAENGGRIRRVPQSELMPYMDEATDEEIDALFQ